LLHSSWNFRACWIQKRRVHKLLLRLHTICVKDWRLRRFLGHSSSIFHEVLQFIFGVKIWAIEFIRRKSAGNDLFLSGTARHNSSECVLASAGEYRIKLFGPMFLCFWTCCSRVSTAIWFPTKVNWLRNLLLNRLGNLEFHFLVCNDLRQNFIAYLLDVQAYRICFCSISLFCLYRWVAGWQRETLTDSIKASNWPSIFGIHELAISGHFDLLTDIAHLRACLNDISHNCYVLISHRDACCRQVYWSILAVNNRHSFRLVAARQNYNVCLW
jgi:hypothetical protein